MKRHAKAASTATFLLALALIAGVTSAQAASFGYNHLGNFAETIGSGPGEFETQGRMAVDEETGNLYVVDRGNDRVQVFAPDGDSATYLTEITAGFDNPFGIAIEQSSGPADEIDLYVSDAGNSRIVKLTSDGEAVPVFSADPSFTSPSQGSEGAQVGDFEAALAVDQSTGELLVADSQNNLVKRFSSTGAHLSSFDGSTSPGGAFVGLTDITTAPTGDVYVVDAEGPVWVAGEGAASRSRVERFDSTGAHLATISPLEFTGFGLVGFDRNVNQVTLGDVAPSAAGTSTWRPDGTFVGTVVRDGGQSPYWDTLAGIAAGGPDSHLYIGADTGVDNAATAIAAYTPVAVPTVSIDPVNVGGTGAALTGTVNPEGFQASWHFEIKQSTESSWTVVPGGGDAGSGTDAEPVSSQATDLEPNTAYQARLAAVGQNGSSFSSPVQFTTAPAEPEVLTRFAAPRTQTTARLNGFVNPRNSETEYWFEYGQTDAYGTTVPLAQDASAGDGNVSVLVSQEISGLKPNTTYHFRIVADNGAEAAPGDTAVEGEDASFTTRGPSETGPPQRGIELVNSPEKGNQAPSPSAFSSDQDKVIWSVMGGAPGSPSGSAGPFLAERTSDGWKSKSLLPAADQLLGDSFRYLPLAFSVDFTRTLFTAGQGVFGINSRLVKIDSTGNHEAFAAMPDDHSKVSASLSTTPELDHIYLNTDQPFDPDHGANTFNVYDVATEPETLVSRMPGSNKPPLCGVAANADTVGIQTGHFGSGEYPWTSLEGGSPRVFFATRGDSCGDPLQLYVRDLSQPSAQLISGPPLSGPDEGGLFVRANPAGDEVVFISASKLSMNDSNSTTDIYKWTAQGYDCLTCIVPEANVSFFEDSESGVGVFVSEDLSRIYFRSSNQLVSGITVPPGEKFYGLHDDQIQFIASVGDNPGSFVPPRGMSDNGRTVVFTTDAPGVTTDGAGGVPQLYRYVESNGSIECISCPQVGDLTPTVAEFPTIEGAAPTTERRPLSADGRSVIFRAEGPLLREDINGTYDVYEWSEGKLRLVTDGETVAPSGSGTLFLYGISGNGDNVLFRVGANLTGHEGDSMPQVYTAHRGGGFPPPPIPPAICDGDSCQGPLTPEPSLGSSASATFAGPGNRAVKPKQRKRGKPKPRRCFRQRQGGAAKSATRKGKAKCKPRRAAKGKGRVGR